ncbi:hypothetical protein [Pedobacter cryotolerans]|uniref:Uncharacterized protein n=1 Tax=Pedobacter cryotolerans TaxID=2571270 RepID=A0A4U1CAK9_9SPHI|nr:hypothetical protein [Pedobacter cryotolerans]TKC01499.1 hypothetical protein FA045_09695 [Pedobacter cryotolerans]
MLSRIKKNISFIATVVVIIIISIAGYFVINKQKGPFSASELVSIEYKWGLGDSLVNAYNSASGNYQYLDNRDSLITKKLKLRANNIIFIHSKANELDLWTLPNVIANKNANLKTDQTLRYEIIFNYETKVKKIVFLTNYDEDMWVLDRVSQLQKTIKSTIDEVEDRYTNP